MVIDNDMCVVMRAIPGFHSAPGKKVLDRLFPQGISLENGLNLKGPLGEYITHGLLELAEANKHFGLTSRTYTWGVALVTLDIESNEITNINWDGGEIIRQVLTTKSGRKIGKVTLPDGHEYEETGLAFCMESKDLYLELTPSDRGKLGSWENSTYVNLHNPEIRIPGYAINHVVNLSDGNVIHSLIPEEMAKINDGIYMLDLDGEEPVVLVGNITQHS